MASPLVVSAVETRLSANWANTPIVLPNAESAVPADGSAFLVLEFTIANEEQISIGKLGERAFREEGVFLLTLCIPAGVGLNPVATPYHTWLDALRTAFRGQSFSGVNTWAPSAIVENGGSSRGAFYEMAVAVPYYIDLVG